MKRNKSEGKMDTKINSEIKTYVKFYYPGAFFAETEIVEIETFNPLSIIIPDGAYAFQSYKVKTLSVYIDGVLFTKRQPPFEKTKMHYPGGQVLTLQDIESEFGADSILYKNIKYNGYQYALKTRCGNYQFYDPDKDIVYKETDHEAE